MPLTILRRQSPPPDAFLALSGSDTGTGTDASSLDTGASWLANKPSGWNTLIREFDPSWSVPGGTPGAERSINGGPWSVIFDDGGPGGASTFSRVADSEPGGRSFAWDLIMAAGSYGGGVPGSGEGNTFGNIGVPFAASTDNLYWCVAIWFSADFYFHPVSHKGNRSELSGGNFLGQIKHNSDWWRPSDESIGQDYDAFKTANTTPTTEAWHIWEGQLIRGNPGTLRIWWDDILQYECTSEPLGTTSAFSNYSQDGHLGGGGFTLPIDQHMRLGTILLYKP